MNMEVLTDEQLNHLIRVVALDLKLKSETFHHMKILERQLSRRLTSVPIGNCCAVCLRSFNLFHRANKCPQCSNSVCKNCIQNQCCNICNERKRLNYKRREWSILCPFKENQFGYAKFMDRDYFEGNIKGNDWILYAKMELHIIKFLNEEIDSADVQIIIVCAALERARRMLVSALEEFDTAGPFLYIDDALGEIQENAKIGSIKSYPIYANHCSYFQLLSYAVVSFMVARNTRRSHRPLLQQFSADFTNLTLRPYRPTKSVELNDVPTFERNWFMKERYLRIGSCFTQPAFNRRPTFVHQMIPSTSSLDGHSQNSEHSYDDLSEPSTELSIRISHREIHVHTGELITISSVVHSDDSEVDVKWYNGEKEISNSGRYRLSRKGWQFQLQIFDCDVIDQGEITCLAINSISVASDVALLHIHEEDIAGEEPMFIEPLVFEQNGMSITLKCSVIGYPIPYVTFHRRNRRIPSDIHSVMQRDGELWTLKMDGCSVDDEGRYAAIARNRIGRAISHCKVTIAHKPPSSYIADV